MGKQVRKHWVERNQTFFFFFLLKSDFHTVGLIRVFNVLKQFACNLESWASQVALAVKKIYLPMQEMQVRSLGREDPLEEDVATHSSILG